MRAAFGLFRLNDNTGANNNDSANNNDQDDFVVEENYSGYKAPKSKRKSSTSTPKPSRARSQRNMGLDSHVSVPVPVPASSEVLQPVAAPGQAKASSKNFEHAF